MNHSLTRQNRVLGQQTPCPVLSFRNVLWQIDAKNWIFYGKMEYNKNHSSRIGAALSKDEVE